MSLRVLIVDDHALFRDGLRSLLERQSDMLVVGEAGDGASAVRLAGELTPDIILMDLHLPQRSGIEAIIDIVAQGATCRIIVLTMYHDDELIDHAIQAGAAGYVLKDSRAAELLAAIRTVAAGGAAVDPTVAAQLLDLYRRGPHHDAPPDAPALATRELQLLQHLTAGLSNRQIAAQLYLSEQTVKNLLSALYQKLGVSNRTEAVMAAISRGLTAR